MIIVDFVFVESESLTIYNTNYFIKLSLSYIFRTKKFERKSFLAEPKLPITYFKEAEDPSYQNLECYVPQEILSSVSFPIFSRKLEIKIILSCNTELFYNITYGYATTQCSDTLWSYQAGFESGASFAPTER